jgi:hypothetical protein
VSIDDARAIHAAGWNPIPLPARQKAEPPRGLTGWRGRYLGEADLDAFDWTGNMALRLPPDVAGLDIDAYAGGNASLTALEARFGPLPPTVASTSRQDGSGIALYRIPMGTHLRTDPAEGIQMIQAHHRYVLCAPSIHPEDRPYRWYDLASGEVIEAPPHPGELPELPWRWIEGLATEATEANPAATPAVAVEFMGTHTTGERRGHLDAVFARYVDVQKGWRHGALVSMACWLVREVAAGFYPGEVAIGRLFEWWRSVTPAEPWRHDGEFGSAVLWSIGQATDERVAEVLARDAAWQAEQKAEREAINAMFRPSASTGQAEDEAASSVPCGNRRNRATAPPAMASEQRILDRFGDAVRRCGLVGERATAQLLYLVLTSRLLDRPVSAGVKGHSASGKSFVVQLTSRFFPPEAVIEMTAMSQRALVYSKEDFRHRVLVLYELVALREGVEDDLTSYIVRSLLSEGRLVYQVTVRDKEHGGWTTRTIEKEGPTGLIFTTTRTRVHRENETRVLSLASDDSRDQTRRVLDELAVERGQVDLAEWVELQGWLAAADDNRVTIPYARALAGLVPPVAVRLRRDFGAVLSLIRAHAVLHKHTRHRDPDGRIVANLDDYEVVADLVAPLVAQGVGSVVSPVTRETVATVENLSAHHPGGVTARAVAERLGIDKSNAGRRLGVAAADGWIVNLEDRRGRSGRWVIGDRLPPDRDVLPGCDRLREVAESFATPDDDEGAGQTT